MTEAWSAGFAQQYMAKFEVKHDAAVSRTEALGALSLAGHHPMREAGAATVLDVPCGFGRHSRALSDAGYLVIGVDSSAEMLRAARERHSGRAAPLWVRADYRNLPIADASVDVAINLFTSFGYFGDEGDRDVLAEIHRVLRPGGTLVLDTTHRDRLGSEFTARAERDLGDRTLREDNAYDLVTGWMSTSHTYVTRDGDRTMFQSRLRVYAVSELVTALRATGFSEVRAFGGLDGRPLDWTTRLVLVAQRARDGSSQ